MTYVVLPIYYGKRIVADTWVDEDISETLSQHRLGWAAGYAFIGRRWNPQAPRLIAQAVHRFVAGLVPNDGLRVHHINEDHFDNRRENLVVVETELEHAALPHPWRNSAGRGPNPTAHHYRMEMVA